MKVLLDTNVLLWLLAGDQRLSATAREKIENASDVLISEASLWEIAIKISIKKLLPIPDLYKTLQDLSFERLHIEDKHIQILQDLPFIHRDPFDRMLVAQALFEGVPLITSDAALKNYGIAIIQA